MHLKHLKISKNITTEIQIQKYRNANSGKRPFHAKAWIVNQSRPSQLLETFARGRKPNQQIIVLSKKLKA